MSKLRCPGCRTRRATFTSLVNHIAASGHRLCRCGGYHFAHRPCGGYCHQHEMATARDAARRGAEGEALATLIAEVAFDTPGRRGQRCPF